MTDRSIFILFIITSSSCLLFSNSCYSETDTLQQGQPLTDWDELISSNRVFILKFFSVGTSVSPYIGIFYNRPKILPCVGCDESYYFKDAAVWVANRNNPIPDIYGKLMIDVHGDLRILSGGGILLDLCSPTPLGIRNASARLLDSENFVLQELYPDNGTDQVVILRRGNIYWNSGPWQDGRFLNLNQSSDPDEHSYYISNETEISFTYLTKTYDSFPAVMMYPDGSTFNFKCQSVNDPPGCAEVEFEKLKCRKGYYISEKYVDLIPSLLGY